MLPREDQQLSGRSECHKDVCWGGLMRGRVQEREGEGCGEARRLKADMAVHNHVSINIH